MPVEPNADGPDLALGDRARVALWALPPLVAIVAGVLHGTHFIDDAFITFRYAENLAAGRGLVFNPGAPVLGTTTPLFAMVLAALKTVGLAVPTAASGLGLLSMAGVVVLLQLLARRAVSLPVAAAMALCVALHPDTAFMATSGMETAASLGLVIGGLLLALDGRWLLAGGVGGAAMLMRPDGVLVVALAVGLALLKDRASAWKPALTAAVVSVPWALYAAATYGSPLPHSIKAKKLIHATAFGDVLRGHVGLLTQNAPLTILLALGVVGFVFAVLRRSELFFVALWMGAYFGSLAVSGIAPQFAWYATPLTVTGVVLAAYGLDQAAALVPSRSRWLRPGAPIAVLLGIAALGLAGDNWRTFRTDLEHREAAYHEIGAWIAERAQPGDVVFVGEVGVLCYELLDQVLVDSSGINSPEIFALRQAEYDGMLADDPETATPEGTWRWVQQAIDDLEPDYVVTKYPWLHIGRIEDSAGFQALYERTGPDNIMLIEYRVYARR